MVCPFPSAPAARPFAAVLLTAMLTVASAAVLPAAAAATIPPATYIPPVAGATVVDHFRAPTTPYGAGNRGIDEVTTPGTPVVASAAGRVIFAGVVAGSRHVTVLHPDGLRSSYSYLAAIAVRVGDQVEQGASLGLTAAFFHFGIRDPSGTYLDPELLFGGRAGAHLVAGPDEGGRPLVPPPGWIEQVDLAELVRSGQGVGSRLTQRALAIGHEARSLSTPVSLIALTAEIDRWHDQQRDCTPASAPVPGPRGRRIAVLVGGLGSSSDHAAVDEVDVATLGYAPADVVRFSYRGGTVPRPAAAGPLAALATSTYGPIDTEVDLHESGDRLLALLEAVSAAEPGVPIDVIAHSQGGLVARLAIARAVERPGGGSGDAEPAGAVGAARSVGVVVTLGTPHQGADLATALAAVDARSAEGRALGLAGRAAGLDLDLTRPSVQQLSETSPVVNELARPGPDGVHLLSVGASGDLTVPDVRTNVVGDDHVTVHLAGPHAHDRLPGDPATTREIGLAIAGAKPTCADVTRGLTDVVVSHLIAQGEDALGLALTTPTP